MKKIIAYISVKLGITLEKYGKILQEYGVVKAYGDRHWCSASVANTKSAIELVKSFDKAGEVYQRSLQINTDAIRNNKQLREIEQALRTEGETISKKAVNPEYDPNLKIKPYQFF